MNYRPPNISVNPFVLAVLCFAVFTSGCKYIDEDAAHTEGVVIYDVEFPDQRKSILMNVYPSEMRMEFRDNMMHGRLESIGGLVSSEIIVDTEKKRYWQLLDSFGDKISCELNEDQVNEFIIPAQRKMEHTGCSTFLGLDCSEFETIEKDGKTPVELVSTKDIDIDNANWYTPFADVDGLLLLYELEQWGMRMRLKAREVRFEKVDKKRFDLPDDYAQIPADSMYLKLEELMKDMPK